MKYQATDELIEAIKMSEIQQYKLAQKFNIPMNIFSLSLHGLYLSDYYAEKMKKVGKFLGLPVEQCLKEIDSDD